MPFYYDTIYWILLIPVLVLSVYAQIQVSGVGNTQRSEKFVHNKSSLRVWVKEL